MKQRTARPPRLLPVGKLPPQVLGKILARVASADPRVVLGPGLGLDCAAVQMNRQLLVLKSDPITFTAEDIGWYLVQVNANDLATTGAQPRWLMLTMLLPENGASARSVQALVKQVRMACDRIGTTIIGGHTEITFGLERPILVGTLLGEVQPDRLVTPQGARPGDRVLLTKGVPIEATSILAREFPAKIKRALGLQALEKARRFLRTPGISVLDEAQIALSAGPVSSMHDPTEGGLLGALWELADASRRALEIDLSKVPVPALSQKICALFQIDPLAAIASGALLLTAPPPAARAIRQALAQAKILCAEIGMVTGGGPAVWQAGFRDKKRVIRPKRDELARIFESPGAKPQN